MSVSMNNGADWNFPVYNEPPIPGLPDGRLELGQWPATKGETHQASGPYGRDIRCSVSFLGFESQPALQASIDSVQYQSHVLQGTLTIDSVTYADCTFTGYEEADRFLDGSGVNGWTSHGVLTWRQATIPAPAPS